MRVLVTGGAGYIGSQFVYALLDNDIIPVVVDDFSTGNPNLIPKNIDIIEADIGNSDDILKIFSNYKFDAVVHFAASTIVSESVENPLKYYENNTQKTFNFLKAFINSGIKSFIFSSTAAVYGEPKKTFINESISTNPINPYGKSKLMSENIIIDCLEKSKSNFIIMRYFNVAGSDPKLRTGQISKNATHLIKVACETAVGKKEKMSLFGINYNTRDGSCIRDYIHVFDLANAHVKALNYLFSGGKSEILNCGYSRGYSVLEVIKAVKKISGIDFKVEIKPPRAGDPSELIADTKKLRKTLNWKPKKDSLELIIQDALEWEKLN
tara:strand:+ start:110 stop:1081 length:972 start_codon:yes stop_codon:yes gene_type:complete